MNCYISIEVSYKGVFILLQAHTGDLPAHTGDLQAHTGDIPAYTGDL